MTTDIHRRMRTLRWTSYTLVAVCYVLAYFHRMAPAAIATDLQRSFSASGAALGSLAAAYFYTYTVMQIPVGVMADTLGIRKIVAIGAALAGVGSLVFGMADTLATATLGRVLVGLGVSSMFISLMKLNSVWFHDRHFGTVGGMSLLLGNMGSVLAATPLVWAVSYTSWRNVFVAVGLFSLLLSVLVWLLVRNHPGEAGLPSMRELEGMPAHPRHDGHWFDGLRTVIKNRASWPGFWPNLGVGGSLFAFAGLWGVPYLRDVYGMSRHVAANHTMLLLFCFAVGALLSGMLSDRLGKRLPVIIGGISLYVLCWLPIVLAWHLNIALSYLQFALMGLGASGFTLTWASAKEVNPPALSGMATSVVNTGTFLGAAILQPLVGWAVDQHWDGHLLNGARVYSEQNYQTGLGIMFAFAVVGLLGALKIHETNCRYILVAK
ncbi:MAG: MFS transporter [Gallionella sp.]|jgi:sugar phosphate permease|nr:MFS transporter [Gallionella sp.]